MRFPSISRIRSLSLFKCTVSSPVDSSRLLSRGFSSASCFCPPNGLSDASSCESRLFNHSASYARTLASVSNSCVRSNVTRHRHDPLPVFPRVYVGNRLILPAFYAGSGVALNIRSFASYFGSRGDGPGEDKTEVSAISGTSDLGGSTSNGGMVGDEWYDRMKEAWRSVVDGFNYSGEKVKEVVSDELTPYAQQLLDSHPYLKNVIIPVSGTLTAATLAWVVMPRILRRIHKYAMRGPVSLLPGALTVEEVPYDKSIWGSLEDPLRYLVTFMAFWQIAMMVAPTTVASQYIGQTWRAAVIASFVWFLYRWKSNAFYRAMAATSLARADREKLLAVDRLSSVGLFVIGAMALAEAFGVAVQSLLTVGGIGGVATAFAARDILGNVLSGLAMQFSKPFSLGDTIKAGSIEGQVVEMGLTTTSLLNAEKFPVIVPNSLFSSQVIVNKSRAEWRAMVTKIPLNSEDLEKIPLLSNDIKSMLNSHPNVFLGKEAPYCFLSRVESSHAELTLGCNLKRMSKDELYSAQQDILLQSALIIKKHGAKLGSTFFDMNTP